MTIKYNYLLMKAHNNFYFYYHFYLINDLFI